MSSHELLLKSVILYNCVFSSVVFVSVSMSIFFLMLSNLSDFFSFSRLYKIFCKHIKHGQQQQDTRFKKLK